MLSPLSQSRTHYPPPQPPLERIFAELVRASANPPDLTNSPTF